MYELFDTDSGDLIGEISSEQLKFLKDQLEETSDADQDYYLHAPSLEMLEEAGADPELIDLLSGALDDREGMEIRWEAVTDEI